MNETELLFETAFKMIEAKFSQLGMNKYKGKIYKIVNDKDNKVYVGSTINDLESRFKYHMDYHANEKTKEYFSDKTIKMDINLILEKEFYFDSEMLLCEDYNIYKYDSITNGLNLKYNTYITKIILSSSDDIFTEKIRRIDREIETIYRDYLNYNNICKDANIRDIINSFEDVYIEDKYFTKFNNDMYVCYPDYLLDKYIDVNDKSVTINYKTKLCDSNMIGIYYVEWDNGNSFIFYKSGGLHTLFKTKSNMYYNKFLKCVSRYGLKFKLYPLYYFKIVSDIIATYSIGDFFRNYIVKLNSQHSKLKNIDVPIYNLLRLNEEICYSNIDGKMNCINLLNDTRIKLFSKQNMKIMDEKNKIVLKQSRFINQENLRIELEKNNKEKETSNNNVDNKSDNVDNKSDNQIDGINYGGFVFRKKLGRNAKYTPEESKKAKLEAKRKWREKNKDRIKQYNKYYIDEKKILGE
jgi:hypothetical protein